MQVFCKNMFLGCICAVLKDLNNLDFPYMKINCSKLVERGKIPQLIHVRSFFLSLHSEN